MKIKFVAGGPGVSDAEIARNVALSATRGLPCVADGPEVRGPLAVVGGGPSLRDAEPTLRDWPGEIWAVNGAYHWCARRGIDTAYFTLDPSPWPGGEETAKAAILADICHPTVFDAVAGPISIVPLGEIPNGPSTASTAPMIAAMSGYESVTLFACESSFVDEEHAYPHAEPPSHVLVRCGGREYLTSPQLIMQAEYIAEIARELPGFVRVSGDGFLPALIAAGDYEILEVSRNIMEVIAG